MNALQWWVVAWAVAALAVIYAAGWVHVGCPRWFLRCTCRLDLPGPVDDAGGRRADPSIGLSPLGGAGEHQWDFTHEDVLAAVPDVERWLEADEWDDEPQSRLRAALKREDGTEAEAEQMMAALQDDAPDVELTAEDWIARDLADLELLAWDARVQAARCWEIVHVEFPRLRAELCAA